MRFADGQVVDQEIRWLQPIAKGLVGRTLARSTVPIEALLIEQHLFPKAPRHSSGLVGSQPGTLAR